jgi:uncharacterized protein (DUF934 family)
LKQLVKPRGRRELEGRLAFALLAHRVDHVGALAPLGDHVRDQLRRVLQVGVDHRHHVAHSVLQASRQGGLVAEVARQVDHPHAAVARGDLIEQPRRVVAGAVVD